MQTIGLDEFLAANFPGGQGGAGPEEVVDLITATRRRELLFRRWLPARVVRRLDRGFARSNTVHPDTASALYSICRQSGAVTVFETGTYWGFSTCYLAMALEGRAGAKVWTFDIDRKAGRHIPKSLAPRIKLVRGRPSCESMPPVLDHVVPDLFFQDSRHDYEGVRDELRLVAPRLTNSAVVLFHDFIEPAVRRAAQEELQGFETFVIANGDPQQLGVAIRRARR